MRTQIIERKYIFDFSESRIFFFHISYIYRPVPYIFILTLLFYLLDVSAQVLDREKSLFFF